MTVPAWVEPQLATLTEDRFSDPAWVYERKLDGERCLAFRDRPGSVRLLTRNARDISGTFPEVAKALDVQCTDACVVDGEIVSFDGEQTSFGRLQQRLGVARPSGTLIKQFPVFYYVFDVMYAGNRDLRPLPELERKRVLGEVLRARDPVRYTQHRSGDGVALWREACDAGWEGLIAKNADAPYRGGRTRNWLKFKCVTGQEFVIGGFTDPKGSREGFGALLLGYYDPDGRLSYAGKVGTGFDTKTLHELRERLGKLERATPAFQTGKPPRTAVHWVEPHLVGQISFAEWTSDGLLRQPRFQGLRDDKPARDVVRERPA